MTSRTLPPGPVRRMIGACCGRMLSLLPLALVLAATGWGVAELWRLGLDDPRYRVDGQTRSLVGAVRECPEAEDVLVRLAAQLEGRSLLDPRLPGDARRLYVSNGWVREVRSVRREWPNRLRVDFVLGVPAAQVFHGGRYWLIDSEARLLPAPGVEAPMDGLSVIAGAADDDLSARPGVGGVWNGSVAEALDVLGGWWGDALSQRWRAWRIAARSSRWQDVAGQWHSSRTRYELELRSWQGGASARVRWGIHNRRELPEEPATMAKFEALRALFAALPPDGPDMTLDVATRVPGFSAISRRTEGF